MLGFLGPSGLVFVCGSKEGLIDVTGRRHNTDDIIATVLAVEPMKFIYRGRIAVFSIKVLKDERIIIVAEQRPESSEEEVNYLVCQILFLYYYLYLLIRRELKDQSRLYLSHPIIIIIIKILIIILVIQKKNHLIVDRQLKNM